jgi:hypothetical protein
MSPCFLLFAKRTPCNYSRYGGKAVAVWVLGEGGRRKTKAGVVGGDVALVYQV